MNNQHPDNQPIKNIEYYLELDEFGFRLASFEQSTWKQKAFKIGGFFLSAWEVFNFLSDPYFWEYEVFDWVQLLSLTLPAILLLWRGYSKIPAKPFHFYRLDEEKITWKRGFLENKTIYWHELKKIVLYADCVEFFTKKRKKCYRLWFKNISIFDKTLSEEFCQMILIFAQKKSIPLEQILT